MNGLPERGEIYIKMSSRISNLFEAIQNATKSKNLRVRTQNVIDFSHDKIRLSFSRFQSSVFY